MVPYAFARPHCSVVFEKVSWDPIVVPFFGAGGAVRTFGCFSARSFSGGRGLMGTWYSFSSDRDLLELVANTPAKVVGETFCVKVLSESF